MVKKNREIGRIPSWGPLFRVSFDMKINSSQKTKWTSNFKTILDFKGNGGTRDCCEHGDRIPSVLYEKNYKVVSWDDVLPINRFST